MGERNAVLEEPEVVDLEERMAHPRAELAVMEFADGKDVDGLAALGYHAVDELAARCKTRHLRMLREHLDDCLDALLDAHVQALVQMDTDRT